jgi:SAM-dependent methyltransferase
MAVLYRGYAIIPRLRAANMALVHMGPQTAQIGLKTFVPRSLRSFLLNLYCFTLDGLDLLRGRRDALTPPRRLLRLATDPSSDFRETGRVFLDFLIGHCGLRPDHKVLDVGCGVGRIAVALTDHLDQQGQYEGFDVAPQEIAWCRNHISTRFPLFRFQVADVHNLTYNPMGGTRASEYRFPYDDDSFDLVVLASVFTHMLSRGMERYVMEVARVLKRGGRCFVSFYLLNDESRRNIRAGTSAFEFESTIDDCYVEKADSPELAVAHEEDRVRALFTRCQLSIEAVFYGTWSSKNVQAQDIMVASRVS